LLFVEGAADRIAGTGSGEWAETCLCFLCVGHNRGLVNLYPMRRRHVFSLLNALINSTPLREELLLTGAVLIACIRKVQCHNYDCASLSVATESPPRLPACGGAFISILNGGSLVARELEIATSSLSRCIYWLPSSSLQHTVSMQGICYLNHV
jgi:hypothetical protein